MVDIQIPKIIEQVRISLPDLRPSDLDDFERVLVCLSGYAAMVAQTGVFKGKSIDEKRDFQQHLLPILRMKLGEDVREAETVGGGILDLRYRHIVIELKVESNIKDRKKLKEKYISQPWLTAAVTTLPNKAVQLTLAQLSFSVRRQRHKRDSIACGGVACLHSQSRV